MHPTIQRIIEKKKKLTKLRRTSSLAASAHKFLDEWTIVELTYTSNAIEGNTLSRLETAQIIEKGITIGGKSMKEHNEALNHAEALKFMIHLALKKEKISEKNILGIHEIILKGIDNNNAGRYRRESVRIAGSRVVLPNPAKVPKLMSEFALWLHTSREHPIMKAISAHLKFVTIHPFIDGNGRTGRLLMNLMLIKAGYPPAIIPKEGRIIYLKVIEKAQLTGDANEYEEFMCKCVEESLDAYLTLNPITLSDYKKEQQKLLKIGDLAKAAEESVPTIRHWTSLGLIKVADHTPGGYFLYEPAMIERAKKIRKLQKEKRLSLSEMKHLDIEPKPGAAHRI